MIGYLAPSRALGDFYFKQNKELDAKEQMVTSFPDITQISLDELDEFIVLACDGIPNNISILNIKGSGIVVPMTKLSNSYDVASQTERIFPKSLKTS